MNDPRPIGLGNLSRNLRKFSAETNTEEVVKKIPQEEKDDVAQLAVDVCETNDTLFIIAPLAGVAPAEVKVEITEDVVTIAGERVHPITEIRREDALVQECYFGPFSRSIVLPESVDSKRAKAEFKKKDSPCLIK